MYTPAVDLSALTRSQVGQLTFDSAATSARLAATFNELVGHEWAQMLVKNRRGITLRSGSILKRDTWKQTPQGHSMFKGASNFRRIECFLPLYATGQPSERAIGSIVEHLQEQGSQNIRWLNLREEPLICTAMPFLACVDDLIQFLPDINGIPYVLRDEVSALRNNRSLAGISGRRLELLEDRLKLDIIDELKSFEGRLLCHQEQEDGSVVPVWETTSPDSVRTLRETMETEGGELLDFHRLVSFFILYHYNSRLTPDI